MTLFRSCIVFYGPFLYFVASSVYVMTSVHFSICFGYQPILGEYVFRKMKYDLFGPSWPGQNLRQTP